MSLGNMSIRWRLGLGFGLVIALLVVVAATSLLRLSQFSRNVDDFGGVRVPKLIAAAAWVESLLQTAVRMRDPLILDDEKQIKEVLATLHKQQEQRLGLGETLGKKVAPGKEKELFQAILDARDGYSAHEQEFLKLAERGDYATAKDVMLERVRPAQRKYIQAISAFSDYEVAESARDSREANAAYNVTAWLIASLAALAVLVGLAAATLIIRRLVGGLRHAGEVLEAMAQGDFTQRLEIDTDDEMGQMATALNEAVTGMRTALQQVSVAAGHAAEVSRQLSAASDQLSGGAQEQASSLEETAASLEQITGAVKQSADNARQANELAVGSRDVAEKGGEVVAHAVASMAEINKSSKKIADIITTIDEIAFQTNLLALNAAVEAARAGEHGRGFAVVATEVRNLAQRSATAAKEIKGLIQDSVHKVDAGSDLVNRSGQTLSEIVRAVKRVTDIIAEIAAASQEQSAGIDQVNRAVTQMDTVTQTNAAQTEELSSTAQVMATQAHDLQTLVARFRLGEHTPVGRPNLAPASPLGAPKPRSGAGHATVKRPSRGVPAAALVAARENANGASREKDDFEEF